MNENTVEAEIVEDDFKAPVLKDIKYPVKTVELDELLSEYSEVPTIDPESDEAGEQYKYVLKGHKAFVKARTSIEKVRKELKAPALEYGKKVDYIAKEFQAKIVSTEQALFIQRKIVEDNEQRKIEEAEALEADRVSGIRAKIEHIKNLPLDHYNSNSETLTKVLEAFRVATEEEFNEFKDEARLVTDTAIQQIQSARETKVKAEQADRIESENRARLEAEEAERKEKERAEREAFEAEKESFRKAQQEAEDKLKAQQEAINMQNAAREAEELSRQQEIERVNREDKAKHDREERAKANTKLLRKMQKEALEDMDDKTTSEILEAIVAGEVRHIFWGCDNE